MSSIDFDAFDKAILDWHAGLQAGPRARLRRAAKHGTVGTEPTYFALLHRLAAAGVGPERATQIAAIAGLLAHIKPVKPTGTAESTEEPVPVTPPDDEADADGRADEPAASESQRTPKMGQVQRLGRSLAASAEGRGLTELRFRRLLAARDLDELALRLRRAIQVVGDGAPILGLAHTAFSWGDRTRQALALGYYTAQLHAEPSSSDS